MIGTSPAMSEIDEVVTFRLPLRLPFRGVAAREGMLLHGPAGWGEWAPFVEYDDVTAARWLTGALEAAGRPFPLALREHVACAGIVPALTPDQAAQEAFAAVTESGVGTLKVKVAGPRAGIGADIERIDAILDAVPDHVRLRLDANRGWSVSDAVDVTLRFPAARIDYLEQPCATLDECADVRRRTGLRVAVDEGLRLDDPSGLRLDLIEAAADLLVVKAAPLGGIVATIRLVESVGLPVVVSGAMDSAVGLSAGIALAAALPGDTAAAGLGTGRLLARDVTDRALVPSGGVLPVERVAPSSSALAAVAMEASRVRWWSQRLVRCAALLASTGRVRMDS